MWKDISSFNQSDKTRTPYVFELQLGDLKLGLAECTFACQASGLSRQMARAPAHAFRLARFGIIN